MVAGGAALAALLAMTAAVGAWELYRIAEHGGTRPLSMVGIALAGIVPLGVHARYLELWHPSLAVPVLAVVGVLAASLWLRGPTGQPLSAVAITLLGVVYTGGMLGFAYAIRYHQYAFADAQLWGRQVPAGALLLLLPLFVTWTSDVGGYAVGRTLGRHKLMPSVSPGKTVEGAIGAVVASGLVAWLYTATVLGPAAQLGFRWRALGAVAFGAVLSVAAQLGDLVESMLKREAGVKDSSHLLPGHGGVLDRLDALFFVLPVSYVLLGGMLTWAGSP